MNPPPITLDRVTLRHGRRDIVRDLSGVFAPGSLTALIGPNGSGKTTLLRALARLHAPAQGRIDLGGLVRHDIALLPQASAMDRSFPITCRDVVALGMTARLGPFRAIGPAHLDAADQALVAVGLHDHGKRQIGALSAGQFQRVLFARMIVQDAPVLLLDEPFSAVDPATLTDLLAILHTWHLQGRTIVTVLHDLDLVHDAFPRTLMLSEDRPIWGTTAATLTEANRQRAGLSSRSAWSPRHHHAA